MANDEITRLGEHVSARRRELGLSQLDVWKAGGPSNSTLTGLENGTAKTVSSSTLKKLDHSLSWESGSALRILNGGSPQELLPFQIDSQEAAQRGLTLEFQPKDLDLGDLVMLMRDLSDLSAAVARAKESGNLTEDVARAVKAVESRVYGIAADHMGGAGGLKDFAEALMYAADEAGKSSAISPDQKVVRYSADSSGVHVRPINGEAPSDDAT